MSPIDTVFIWGLACGIALTLSAISTGYVCMRILEALRAPEKPFTGEHHDGRP